uniref:Uncharacterized protein n=1 Tax=Leersia perrieri TaxID=77586 RepID=A0A0D9WFF1_9ORYZ
MRLPPVQPQPPPPLRNPNPNSMILLQVRAGKLPRCIPARQLRCSGSSSSSPPPMHQVGGMLPDPLLPPPSPPPPELVVYSSVPSLPPSATSSSSIGSSIAIVVLVVITTAIVTVAIVLPPRAPPILLIILHQLQLFPKVIFLINHVSDVACGSCCCWFFAEGQCCQRQILAGNGRGLFSSRRCQQNHSCDDIGKLCTRDGWNDGNGAVVWDGEPGGAIRAVSAGGGAGDLGADVAATFTVEQQHGNLLDLQPTASLH